MKDESVIELLQSFQQDPRKVLTQQRPVETVKASGGEKAPPPFTKEDVRTRAFVKHRDEYRQKMVGSMNGIVVRLDQIEPGKSPILDGDRAEMLVDLPASKMIRHLAVMEERKLQRGELEETPWPSWYMGTYRGQLGFRYADPGYPRTSHEWQDFRDYVQRHPASAVAASGDATLIDRLSPSEKYDLLVGDTAFGLTEGSWRTGHKGVARWHGICHGWAPASYMLPRPRRPVKVVAADGRTPLTFHPADIKSLMSLLWATGAPPIKFIGGRCDDVDLPTDEIGRQINPAALDTNPGTWHLAVTNQIGVAGRSLVLDATYHAEVWNQPMYGYRYRYFNPSHVHPNRVLGEDDQPPAPRLLDTWKDAVVERGRFTNDLFARYRSPQARSFVGIVMEVTWANDTTLPSHGPQDDDLAGYTYVYDLELDANGRILGGEWYQNHHPDFLWTPHLDDQAASRREKQAQGEWSGSGPVPAGWREAAIQAAGHQVRDRNGNVAASPQPLAKIIMPLLKLSRT